MDVREKVIKGLEHCLKFLDSDGYEDCVDCPYCEDFFIGTCQSMKPLMTDALGIMQEQDAVEPREQEETRTWTVCGNCSQHLISKWLWCPYCGRAVKWDADKGT